MDFTHLDKNGNARMVDVSDKIRTERTASATCNVHVTPNLLRMIQDGIVTKGDVFTTAKIAGIQAAKKTSELVPLCHNIFISFIDISFEIKEQEQIIIIASTVKTSSQTGVEMEALNAVSVAALTLYDMCKSVDKSIVISDLHLVTKTGGKSGDFHFSESEGTKT